MNAVVPSAIDTPALDKLGLDPETKTAFADFMSKRVLVGRMARRKTSRASWRFFVSPAAGFITGSLVPIDGGMGVS